MTDHVASLLHSLDASHDVGADRHEFELSWIAEASSDQLSTLLEGLLELARRDAIAETRLLPLLQAMMQASKWRQRGLSTSDPDNIGELYLKLGDKSTSRQLLLAILAQSGDRHSLSTFAELMAVDSPRSPQAVVQACLPLWRSQHAHFEVLFPRLLDAIQNPAAATVVLDLANFLSVNGRLARHPAESRRVDLLALFARLIERLEGLEQTSLEQGVTDLQTAHQVAESIGLAVALCYALSLIKERDAVGRFYRMLDLRHRRLRVEAAAALARLKEAAGNEALVQLAAEPSVRLSVLAYASELGILDDIAAEHRSPLARAEASLVARMAEPSFFGFPPGEVELVDTRVIHWPGFDEAVECFLFRFTYDLPVGKLSNVGLAGPVAHAFVADLTHLPMEDVYAAFAGWEAEHDEITQYEIDETNPAQAMDVQRYRRLLEDAGIEAIDPEFVGDFFGDRCLVAAGVRAGLAGFAVASGADVEWYSSGDSQRPLNAELAYSIYKGRKLLRSFNEDEF